ncbi:MAG: 23S rRNA (pseudouridine(1915)-N(3))-methyltransferase RlmH [bacterium]
MVDKQFTSILLCYMKVNIIAISDSDKHFDSAIQEYLKRLGKDCSITTIKPEKNGTRDQIIHKETTKILEKIQ